MASINEGSDKQYTGQIGIRTRFRGGPYNVFGVVVARQAPSEYCHSGRYQVVTDNGSPCWMEDLVLRGPDFEVLEGKAGHEEIEKLLVFTEAEKVRKEAERGAGT